MIEVSGFKVSGSRASPSAMMLGEHLCFGLSGVSALCRWEVKMDITLRAWQNFPVTVLDLVVQISPNFTPHALYALDLDPGAAEDVSNSKQTQN